MNIHIYTTLLILLAQPFSCSGAEARTEENKLIFESVCNYFPSPREKYPFPEPYRQQLIDFCVKKKPIVAAPLKEDKHHTDIELFAQEIQIVRKENQVREKKIVNQRQELDRIEKGNKLLREKIAVIEAEKTKKSVQKNNPIVKNNNNNPPPKKNAKIDGPLTTGEIRQCWKLLNNKYHQKETKLTLEKMKCYAYEAYRANNSDFYVDCHLWRNELNHEYKFVFWPCGKGANAIRFFRIKDRLTLPKSFGCHGNCQSYQQQNDTSSDTTSSSHESDSSSTDSTDSESEEECKDAILLKQEIEAIAN